MIKIEKINAGWFSSVMGTGALSSAVLSYSEDLHFLRPLSAFLTVLASAMYFLMLILWLIKIALYPREAKKEILNPTITHAHGMVGISAMIVSFCLFNNFSLLSFPLWCFGALLTISFSLIVPHLLMISSKIEWKEVTPLWFIPPVGLLVIPMTSLPFLSVGGEFLRILVVFSLSSGLMLYLAMFVLFFGRALLHDPVCCRSLPTLWINLGPLAVGSLAFSTVVPLFPSISVLSPLSVLMYFFSLWWLGILLMQTAHYKRKRRIPFSSSWWALIFPLSALSTASLRISWIYCFPEIETLGQILMFVSLFLWLYVVLRYLKEFLFSNKKGGESLLSRNTKKEKGCQMLELWGVKKLEREGKIWVKIGEEEIEVEGNLRILYGIGNVDPEISQHLMFKFPKKFVPAGEERRYEFWFLPDLILKVDRTLFKVIPRDLKYSLYGDSSEGVVVRRIEARENKGEGSSKLSLKVKNECGTGVEISKVVFPIRYLEGGKESPEEFSVSLYLKIRGIRDGEVEVLGPKRVKYEMLWGFA